MMVTIACPLSAEVQFRKTYVRPAGSGHSRPLRDKVPVELKPGFAGERQKEPGPFFTGAKNPVIPEVKHHPDRISLHPALPLTTHFEGLGNINNSPNPDTEGDVSPDHYFQMVKYSFAVWDKEGNIL